MTRSRFHTVNMTMFVFLLLITISYSSLTAQTRDTADYRSPDAISNLVMGIKSDNPGVRRSAIYFAGKYGISETLLPLMKALRNEKDDNIKYVLAMALYKLGDDRGMFVVKQIACEDSDAKVRNLLSGIYNTNLLQSNGIAAR